VRLVAALACLLAGLAAAQPAERPNGILLIAKPSLVDPNFRETVVLVTQAPDGSTVGVVLNRPTAKRNQKTGAPLFAGGPVMREVTLALFAAEQPPKAPAFHVIQGIYLTMHPANIDALPARPGQRHRFYSGFAGWAPGQLERELRLDAWHVLPASEDVLFRTDTRGLWKELHEKARGGRAGTRFKPDILLS
jgi:putative transcriptional regulator